MVVAAGAVAPPWGRADPSVVHDGLYAAHLARVSRSFAVCIAELQAPLRGWVALSYLLCRLLDTVEDAPWPDKNGPLALFDRFVAFVRRAPTESELRAWQAQLPAGVAPDEQALVADAHHLFAHLHALPRRPQAALRRALQTMAAGMRLFCRRRDAANTLRLHDAREVNHYCYVVAGLVGVLLLELFDGSQPQAVLHPRLRADAVHFGLLLQKINLLKDQRHDEQQGRYLLPQKPAILASLAKHARRAGRFLCALPLQAQPFRRFCAFSLFLAAHSAHAVVAAPGGKLPRAQTLALFDEVRVLCRSNAALRGAVRQAVALLPPDGVLTPPAPLGPSWQFLRRLPHRKHAGALAATLLP